MERCRVISHSSRVSLRIERDPRPCSTRGKRSVDRFFSLFSFIGVFRFFLLPSSSSHLALAKAPIDDRAQERKDGRPGRIRLLGGGDAVQELVYPRFRGRRRRRQRVGRRERRDKVFARHRRRRRRRHERASSSATSPSSSSSPVSWRAIASVASSPRQVALVRVFRCRWRESERLETGPRAGTGRRARRLRHLREEEELACVGFFSFVSFFRFCIFGRGGRIEETPLSLIFHLSIFPGKKKRHARLRPLREPATLQQQGRRLAHGLLLREAPALDRW